MAQPDIDRWKSEIEKSGRLEDRGSGDRDWVDVSAPDGSILQVRIATTYARVVWSEHRDPPFAFWCLTATAQEDMRCPKNLFIGTTVPPEILSAAQVSGRLVELMQLPLV